MVVTCARVPSRFRPVVTAVLLTVVLYWAHRLLQLQHYRHCRADLFRVVLYSQSNMCMQMGNVLHLVEMVYHQAIKLVTSNALGALSGTWGGGLVTGGGGLGYDVLAALLQRGMGV